MRQPSDLRRIAGEIRDRCPGAAGELVGFADFLEDLDAAKQRKLDMIADMPPSRAAMFQKTIAFEQGRVNAAEARVDQLEEALAETLRALGQAVDVITAAVLCVKIKA
jgi:hypothetical protein